MASASPAQRYRRRLVPIMIAYAVLLIAVSMAFNSYDLTGAPAFVLALLPALPIIGVFAIIGRYLVEERDEYIRMMEVRKTVIATGFMLTVATLWGFLEHFGQVPHVPAFYAAVLWFAGVGVGGCVNKFVQ